SVGAVVPVNSVQLFEITPDTVASLRVTPVGTTMPRKIRRDEMQLRQQGCQRIETGSVVLPTVQGQYFGCSGLAVLLHSQEQATRVQAALMPDHGSGSVCHRRRTGQQTQNRAPHPQSDDINVVGNQLTGGKNLHLADTALRHQ